jgi:hypothetical protein
MLNREANRRPIRRFAMQARSHGIRRLSILGAVALLLALPAVASAQRGGGHGSHGGHRGGGHHSGGHRGGHHGGGHHGGGYHGGHHGGSHHGGHRGGGSYGHYGHYRGGGHHHGHYGGYRHYGHRYGHYYGGYYRYGLYPYGYPYYDSYYPYSYSYSYGAPYYRRYVGSYDAVAIGTVDLGAQPEQRRELTADLRQEPGRLSLDVDPADASVYLDDRFVGTGQDLAQGLLIEPGIHVLEVVRPGRPGTVWRFEVAPGGEVAQRIQLTQP